MAATAAAEAAAAATADTNINDSGGSGDNNDGDILAGSRHEPPRNHRDEDDSPTTNLQSDIRCTYTTVTPLSLIKPSGLLAPPAESRAEPGSEHDRLIAATENATAVRPLGARLGVDADERVNCRVTSAATAVMGFAAQGSGSDEDSVEGMELETKKEKKSKEELDEDEEGKMKSKSEEEKTKRSRARGERAAVMDDGARVMDFDFDSDDGGGGSGSGGENNGDDGDEWAGEQKKRKDGHEHEHGHEKEDDVVVALYPGLETEWEEDGDQEQRTGLKVTTTKSTTVVETIVPIVPSVEVCVWKGENHNSVCVRAWVIIQLVRESYSSL